MENLVFKGKISNIYLNKDQDLEISFEKNDAGGDGEQRSHVTIPIRQQIQEQQELNESVYIKIDMVNELKGMEVEEMLFKVLPEGRVERQVNLGPYADSSQEVDASQRVEDRKTSYQFFKKEQGQGEEAGPGEEEEEELGGVVDELDD